jgi:carbohydrate-binding DOMON domain-containing protein
MKSFIAIIMIALVVAGGVSSYEKYKIERQQAMSDLYDSGYQNGYLQGTYNPADTVRKEIFEQGYQNGTYNPTTEIRSQIHNEGYFNGLFVGTGQPIWIERNGWDRNDSLVRFQDVDKILVLANFSTKDICIAQEKPVCGNNLDDYYKIIVKHYSGWGSEGWDSPEFVLDWERKT